jgi:hypothetical protein
MSARIVKGMSALLALAAAATGIAAKQGWIRVPGIPSAEAALPAPIDPRLPDLRGQHSFDGIDLPAVDGFWDRWKLVTVRYRKDNGEQRFVYANDIAWRAMKTNAPYPDGAMFGKVAFTMGDDPAFPNSAEPRRFARIQLMKKDAKRYPASNGWGYAIMTAGAGVPYDSQATTVAACHACHTMVPARDYVFSSAAFIESRGSAERGATTAFKSRFRPVALGDLTPFQRTALSRVLTREPVESVTRVKALAMELFEGSVNESIGALSEFAVQDREVYALWDERHVQFAIAKPLTSTTECRVRARVVITVSRGTQPAASSGARSPDAVAVRLGHICDGRWQPPGSRE